MIKTKWWVLFCCCWGSRCKELLCWRPGWRYLCDRGEGVGTAVVGSKVMGTSVVENEVVGASVVENEVIGTTTVVVIEVVSATCGSIGSKVCGNFYSR